jgi:hypothetical protein
VARIAAFCGLFAAKLCTFAAENYVARRLSGRLFSQPLDYGNLVRIFYVAEIATFSGCAWTVLFKLFSGHREDLGSNLRTDLRCIFCD